MKPSTKRILENDVNTSLSTLEMLVAGFCSGMVNLYPPILTELRKLLADKDAVRSFDKSSNHECLYALQFPGIQRPYLNGFQSTNNVACPRLVTDRMNRLCLQDLLYYGAQRDSLVPLNEWLSTTSVYLGMKLDKVELRSAIRKLAGKEGSHIINQDLKTMSFALSSSIEKADFSLAWKCLIVDIAIRLLCAVRANKKTFVRRHALPARELPKDNNLYILEYSPQGWLSSQESDVSGTSECLT